MRGSVADLKMGVINMATSNNYPTKIFSRADNSLQCIFRAPCP
jgi:hypothetical protein